jgi:lipopolysaccharide/colanic/teichoic acid biosynthesis glycosyltransferase
MFAFMEGILRRAQAVYDYENSIIASDGSSIASEAIHLADYSHLEYLPSRSESPLESWRYQLVKRTFDVLCSSIMILVFAIPGLLIAATIALTSEGSVFYREERIGRDRRRFRIWKFRSMYIDATERAHIAEEHASGKVLEWRMQKHLCDPRITAIGRFLRSWSLDELPQLINVLRGEMSLIGPRPIVEAETAFYGDLLEFYLAATPGLSGLWQVSGRSHVDYAKRAKLDATYVRTWSLKSDFSILFRTVPAVFGRIGAR